ncbi:MAG: hypothetical protein ACOYYI_05105, partial [Chloroflexota bacterium]
CLHQGWAEEAGVGVSSPIRPLQKGADRYMTEPNVIAAEVYGVDPHNRRGGMMTAHPLSLSKPLTVHCPLAPT